MGCLSARHGTIDGMEAPRNKRQKKKLSTDEKIDRLTTIVERRFTAVESKMERGFAAVAEDIADIRNEMATKDDLKKTKEELQSEIRLKAGGLSKRLDFETDKRKVLEVRVTRLEASH